MSGLLEKLKKFSSLVVTFARKLFASLLKFFSGIRIKKDTESVIPVSENQAPVSHESVIQQTKFFTGQSLEKHGYMPDELPYNYDVDKIVIQVRDPWWLHSYWELTGETLEKIIRKLGSSYDSARTVLRVYDVTNIKFNGRNANTFFDINTQLDARNWYVEVAPGKSWCIDLGLILTDGRFITLLRSNIVSTPLGGPSDITDEEWMIPEDMFARLYGLGVGFQGGSQVGKLWKERIFKDFLSSPGAFSASSPVKQAVEKGFWLVADTELIVYGATEPDAELTVQGKSIKLRPDGSFTLRFALPNGQQVIPIEAVSRDKTESRKITPIVSKETK